MHFVKATALSSSPIRPSEEESKLARESSRLLAAFVGKGKAARLKVIIGKEEITVPVAALRLLVDVLAQMAECSRRLNFDPPCRLNIDPGTGAAFATSGCG
jgi:hypothetical protein